MILIKKNIIFLTDLKDIFGNHGPVGLIIGKCLNKKIIFIDTFLISCRVFGRYLESWMLREMKIIAKKKGCKEIYGEYIQTEKNVISKEVLKQHNFKKVDKKKSDKIFKNLKITGELYISSLNNIKFPKAKLFGLTTSAAVMKINYELGYQSVNYNQLTNDEDFRKGCKTCSNYQRLMQAKREKCKCTGMLMDPGKI